MRNAVATWPDPLPYCSPHSTCQENSTVDVNVENEDGDGDGDGDGDEIAAMEEVICSSGKLALHRAVPGTKCRREAG